MKLQALRRICQQEDVNFLLTNRIPRQFVTRFMGWFSQVRHPLVTRLSIGIWQIFTDLDLRDARKSHFESLHDCFTRELVPGARTVDARPEFIISPCDAIVGECGAVRDGQVFQAKGFPYAIADLFGPDADTSGFRGGTYATLRLTSAMYHRFHAPHDCVVERVRYLSGDTWNVNPIALKRVERLFCRNERAVLHARLADGGQSIAIVPVAAILVASIRLHFLDTLFHLRYRGATDIECSARFQKGQEMGWFQHGSTIIVFAPAGFELAAGISTGKRIRMGSPLMSASQ